MKDITDIPGVYASGIHCGIKADPSRKDLAFIYVPEATACAAALTRNAFRAPCIQYTQACIASADVKAVVINSGNANAATGEQGYNAVVRTAEHAGRLLNLEPDQVAVASTGIIGKQLPLDILLSGLDRLLSEPNSRNGAAAAEAILTTDLVAKEFVVQREIDGKLVTAAGFAKGSGMIAPNMATMLAYMAIDAHIEKNLLQQMFRTAVETSFNMISVDSDTSTSDMAMIFATGDKKVSLEQPAIQASLQALLNDVCIGLAKLVARDGEGAEKLIEVNVVGARSERDARAIALNIINSPLVKTAVHGGDPNWGRVAMAVGKDPSVEVDPERVDLFFAEVKVMENGAPLPFAREKLRQALSGRDVVIAVDLKLGCSSATAWGCDLSKRYIDINVDYN